MTTAANAKPPFSITMATITPHQVRLAILVLAVLWSPAGDRKG